ncbi:MAG: hypothetical protein FWC41_00865 [Firmicutes bacterium]|nr:hypothetical protein [Bacillota bacterium]
MYFSILENLYDLEQDGQWEAIRKLLYKQWENHKSKLESLVTLAFECWIVLSEWHCCIKNENLNYDLFKDNLIDVYNYGIEHFDNNQIFQCLFGYMMSLFPNLFYSDDDLSGEKYVLYENKGKAMLEKSYRNNPNNLLAKVLFFGTTDKTKEYNKAREEIKPLLTTLFPGKTAIEQYFKEVLSF